MPFDTTKLRQPTVTVLPPTPPERGGGPQRIVINIDIVDRRPPQRATRPRYRFGTLTLWLLIIALVLALAGCTRAMAQPSSWQSYQDGFLRRYQGTDQNGGQWTGASYKQGFTTYFDANGPHGETQHCTSYELSGTRYTGCQ